MKLTIEIDMGNAAFEDTHAGGEVSRILNEYAGRCVSNCGPMDQPLRDVNGNTVGSATVTD